MNLIAITQRFIEHPYGTYEGLDQEWGRWANRLGVTLIPLLSTSDWKKLFEALPFKGVIVSGGGDLSLIKDTPSNTARDTFERNLISYVTEKSLPLVGICRGCQQLATIHGATVELSYDHVGTPHEVVGPLGPRMVNSFHNYTIRDAHLPLEVLARAPDGTVEAFRHATLPHLGLMWHPERPSPSAKEDVQILKEFFRL